MSSINPSTGPSSDPYDDLLFYQSISDNSDDSVDDPTDPRSPNYNPLLVQQNLQKTADETGNFTTPKTNDDKVSSTSVEEEGKHQTRARRHMKEAADLQQALINSLQQNEDIQKDKQDKK